MEVDYNPQVGQRRTIFAEETYDFLARLVSCEEVDQGLKIVVQTQKEREVILFLTFLSETSFRFQLFSGKKEENAKNRIFDFSSMLKGKLIEKPEYFAYTTSKLQIRLQKKYWEMSIWQNGEVLAKEQVFDTNVDNRLKNLPIGFRMDGEGNYTSAFENMYLFSEEDFWGFGEKFTEWNKRGQLLHCWQKDALSTNCEDSYKGHPFFMSSRGYAILLNTFTRCHFDMGFTSQVSYQMISEDSYLDYCFYAQEDADYKELLKQYLVSTGEIPMIPKWALGFWISKCSYQNRAEIEEVVTTARDLKLPLDVIHIDNWQRKGEVGLWEWDRERFPDPEGMIAWLKEQHVHLSLWNYPYLDRTSPYFKEIADKGYFVKDESEEPAYFYATADSAEPSACFDFTNSDMVEWYKDRLGKILKMGVSVIKTDFSEAVPETAVYADGSSGIEGHNKLTYLYAQTVYRTMQECGGDVAGNIPLLWGRSGYAGSHRIPAAWAGDSSSALNNHSALLKGGLSLAMSGIAFWGFDMGGFYNTGADGNECLPSETEYIRSMEMGFFMTLSRAHGKTIREPWKYSEEILKIVLKYDIMKHKIVPYLYDMVCKSHLESVPALRPLCLEYPSDPTAQRVQLEYMLGDSLLVAPPFDRKEYQVYLPEGSWLNWLKGEILLGGRYIWVKPEIDELPVFQRQNTIIPQISTDCPQYVPEQFGSLDIAVFYESDFQREYYDTDSQGNIQDFIFKAYTRDTDGCLYIETNMDIANIELKSRKTFDRIILNGSV